MQNESTYWRSLRELHDGRTVDELKAHEFMAGVTDGFDPARLSPMSRKHFLALLTASAAFAAAGCSGYRDKGEIVPYTKKPEGITPGVAAHYASTCTSCALSCGILIKTREGRPIKVDGNPDHPVNRGKICSRGQSSVLDLYDPSRLRTPQRGSASGTPGETTWKQVDGAVARHLEECVKAAREIAIIAPELRSPSTVAAFRKFQERYATARLYSYALLNQENRRAAWTSCYGSAALPAIRWERARVIVALESDFLGTEGSVLEQVRAFAAGRDIVASQEFNRLYVIEGGVSLTGSNADYRLRLSPDAQHGLVLALLHEAGIVRGALALDAALRSALEGRSLDAFSARHRVSAPTLRLLVDDLLQHRGAALIVAGDTLPVEAHVAVNALNALLGNDALYDAAQGETPVVPLSSGQELAALVSRMEGGEVGAVIHLGSNPVYHFPGQLKYAQALRKIPLSVCLSETEDETAQLCTYILPAHHAFESWGDYQPRAGVLSLQQPVIAPLYQSRQREAVLLAWAAPETPFQETAYLEFVKSRWQREVYPASGAGADFTAFWFSALHDGVLVTAPPSASLARPASFPVSAPPTTPTDGYVALLTADPFMGDGSQAGNGWLQEIPHPISKVVWDNYASVSPSTAARLGTGDGDLVTITSMAGEVTAPVFVQAGQDDRTITLALGYGRTVAGPVGSNVGVDAAALLGPEGLHGHRMVGGIRLAKAEGKHALVTTQEHHALDDAFVKEMAQKRDIIQEGTLEEFRRDPHFLHHEKKELFSIAKEVEYHGTKWAMAIDLNKCTGCNACVASCNVENNIPVVGKEQVAAGREMQWIRIDRYYAGTPDEPSLSHQPMLCQHCDNAPCENVCPVVATNHSPDGLNQMVYNRCVGTKYCSNNCPYKVRRFNFFNFRDNFADGYYLQEPVELVQNPEVTVRSRGVMEKCTFCVQRIMEERQHAAEQGRAVSGANVRTACQEACPASAIVFGDMSDPASAVSLHRAHPAGYTVLEEVNARPNVTYIARLRNTSEKPA